MVKMPKETEIVMFGERKPASARGEIIQIGKDGKPIITQGGSAGQSQPAPAAKPTPPKPKNSADPKTQGRALAASSVGSMVGSLRAAAEARGGMLSLQDLDAMQADFAEQAKTMEAQFTKAFESFAEAREKLQWNIERKDPLYRLLVKSFSHLFKDPLSRKSVTRRMLPGFFMAIGMILGPDLVSSYRERCRAIVTGIGGGKPDFDWENFYNERETLTVKLDAGLVIASRFSDFERRSNWFINLVNSNLGPASDGAASELQQWELTEQGFRRFLDALLSDVRKILSSDKGRERLAKRHGPDAVDDALKTLKRLITG